MRRRKGGGGVKEEGLRISLRTVRVVVVVGCRTRSKRSLGEPQSDVKPNQNEDVLLLDVVRILATEAVDVLREALVKN